jgi:hypothetical protein
MRMSRSSQPLKPGTHSESKRGRVAVRVLATFIFLAMTAAPQAATTLYVDGTLGNDANACTGPGLAACRTIQEAVNKAIAGDTIRVAAGFYPEAAAGPLTINKTLTLLGAQAGLDARGRLAAESTVTDSQGTSVSASDVVIDGFTFQQSTNNAFTGYGIWMNPGTTGTQILNNIIQDNIVGIGLANSGARFVVISKNQIQANNQPGSASGTGIYTDQFVGGPTVRNVLIEENTFQGHDDAAIDISNIDPGGGVFGLEVSMNLFDGNGRAVLFFNTHNSEVHDNVIFNSTLPLSAAVRIFEGNTNLLIRNNDLTTGVFHGIRISDLGLVGSPSSNIVINFNNISFFVMDGLRVDPLAHQGTVDAECNWWNSSTGPTNPNNPGGTGEEVVGDADFTPWLLGPAPTGPCLGGTPSTRGKVTGGGQLAGQDPAFSTLGVLLSPPAIVPSLADPAAQATFGFVVRCCGASGNLQYNDHRSDVRIKAESINALFITDGTCGADTHATFTGTATVTRPTGTTTESFFAEVDDCGEPGTMDTFRIQTTTYANGPHTLIGGNIQIHK